MKIEVSFEPVGIEELRKTIEQAENHLNSLKLCVYDIYAALENLGVKANQPTDGAAD